MAGMLASARNRAVRKVDDPWDGDGFYRHRRFHGNRKAGATTGKRGWRRALRSKEKTEFRRSLRED
jgi:hypothetical protein